MRRILSIAIILSILNIGCSQQNTNMPTNSSTEHDGVVTNGSSGEFDLNKDAFEENRKLALNGDLIAARKLYDHYAIGLNDTARAMPWMEIIAESGDISAKRTMAFNYMTLGGADNCMEFRYWASIILESQIHIHDSKSSKDINLTLDKEYKNCLEGNKWWGKELDDAIDAGMIIKNNLE